MALPSLAHWLVQVFVVAAVQLPALLHTDGVVSLPAVQLAAVHTVPLSG